MKASLGCPIKEITNAGQCIFGEGGYAVDDALEADEDDGLVVQLIVGMVLASASCDIERRRGWMQRYRFRRDCGVLTSLNALLSHFECQCQHWCPTPPFQ